MIHKDRTVDNILCLPWTESPCISKPSVSRISGTFYLALNIPAYGRGEGCAWTCGSLLLRRRSWWIIIYLTWKVLMRWWKQRRETCWRWTRARSANLVTCKQVKVGFENRKELGIRSEILLAVFARRAVAGLIFLLLLSARDFDFQKARRPDLIIRTIEQNEWSNADHRPRHNDDRPGTQSSNQSHSPPVRFNQVRSNMVSGSARLGGPRISNAGPAGAEHDWF